MSISTQATGLATRAAEATPSAARRPGPPARPARRRRFSPTPYLFLAPGILLFAVTILYPMVQAFQMSFFDWKIVGSATSEFLGLDNYARALGDEQFWLASGNTVVYIVATVIPQIALGLIVALLLHKRSPVQPLYRVLYYLPVVTSWVVVSLLFRFLFADEGLINFTLGDLLHVTSGDTSWLADRWTGLAAICALGIWKGIGWSMMIFLAALQGVPQSLLEAATMDGANRWQRFRAVTLPAIRAALGFVTVMLVIGGFNVFISVYLMTGGGPAGRTDVLLTYMYRQAFEFLDLGYGSAVSVLLTLAIFVLSVIQLRVFRDRSGEVLS
ncbi:carbohydrate ABC transporter permease [Salinibacterium soli]|uniref:Sugar ABC transporter permease n=1 Tax=Antiquaquibacter soli TaxID=3064523 RepID=A0ABT9BT33_9MICO|nr:sugar ABC transporter permease [Protaetiibacter sp. WY-16]MDO7883583.1 sugar ABC transporter permease [Protaetiibacter sp. WY-16]